MAKEKSEPAEIFEKIREAIDNCLSGKDKDDALELLGFLKGFLRSNYLSEATMDELEKRYEPKPPRLGICTPAEDIIP
jgi:hypothetical protein